MYMKKHTVMGFFDRPDFKTISLMRSLQLHLGVVRFIIVWDDSDIDNTFLSGQFEEITVLDKKIILETISRLFSFDVEQLRKDAEGYKPLYKILLAIYCRRILTLDYCIMTDNDIFIFEPIPEIKKLSESQQPFLIPQTGLSCRLPEIDKFIHLYLARREAYIAPNKGKGYNVGFCGLNLTMFDSFNENAFKAFLEVFSRIDVWWKEQTFIVSMMFAFSVNVHTFAKQKYLFMGYNNPFYRMRSKIYHCICTSDKSRVTYYFKHADITLFKHLTDWLLCGFESLISVKRHIHEGKVVLSLILGRLKGALSWIEQITNLINWFVFRRDKMGANRYMHLLSYLSEIRCNRILEIGVWRGDTSRAMLQYSSNREVEYHGIDVFENTTTDLVEKEMSLVAESLDFVLAKLRRISPHVFLHKGYSFDVFQKLQEAGLEFDCIWIDGGHSYETVKFDFEHYSQLLRKGGVIFIDDYTKDSHLPDVKRYVDEELLHNRQYNVKIQNRWIDYYRGFSYKVVSVQLCCQ